MRMKTAGPPPKRDTRLALQLALRRLARVNGYSKVTVEALCREACVGRSTFYTHYAGKEALKAAAVARHALGDVEETDVRATLVGLFRHAQTRAEDWTRSPADDGRGIALQAIQDALAQRLQAQMQGDREERLSASRFAASGVIALLQRWLDRGASSPDIEAARALRLVERVVG